MAKPDQIHRFQHAAHDGYSDLNPMELEFVEALDETGLLWARNPSNGGYSIPLLTKGGSRRFFPDFIVWKDNLIYALDPKGKHLIYEDAGRKLLTIRDEHGKQRVLVRLITEGRWSSDPIKQLAPRGYTVWRNTNVGLRCTHHATSVETVKKAIDL